MLREKLSHRKLLCLKYTQNPLVCQWSSMARKLFWLNDIIYLTMSAARKPADVTTIVWGLPDSSEDRDRAL